VNTRRAILLFNAAILSGCASRLSKNLEYVERFDALAMPTSGKELVVFGYEFDYIFELPEALSSALRSSIRPAIVAGFGSFELRTQSVIRGEWVLSLDPNKLDLETRTRASDLGFKPSLSNGLQLSGSIQGQRYLKSEAVRQGTMERTNQPYSVAVRPALTYREEKQIQPSPVATMPGGALVIYGLFVLLPMFLVLQAVHSK
jgi:hypothetical protein